MAYTKTTWTDRAVQYPGRYLKSGETSGMVTLVENPGTITQAGTPVNAANMNKLEQGVADAFASADQANTTYVLSDTVIVSSPAERASTSAYKDITVPTAGRYRIKAEIRNATGSGTAFGTLTIGIIGTNGQFLQNISVTSTTYGAWSYDLPFLPANSVIRIGCGTSSPVMGVRNVTLCGSPVIGTTNTFSGVDS